MAKRQENETLDSYYQRRRLARTRWALAVLAVSNFAPRINTVTNNQTKQLIELDQISEQNILDVSELKLIKANPVALSAKDRRSKMRKSKKESQGDKAATSLSNNKKPLTPKQKWQRALRKAKPQHYSDRPGINDEDLRYKALAFPVLPPTAAPPAAPEMATTTEPPATTTPIPLPTPSESISPTPLPVPVESVEATTSPLPTP